MIIIIIFINIMCVRLVDTELHKSVRMHTSTVLSSEWFNIDNRDGGKYILMVRP